MNFKIIIFSTTLIFAAILTGCSGTETTNTGNSSNKNANMPSENTNSGNVITTTKKTPEPTTNEAPTLTPVFKAYCNAKTKKDETALKKVYSAKTLKQFEEEMKAENEKSLVKYLEIDQVSNKLCEIRNERIEGDTAIAEVKTEGMPNGVKIKFVRENGEWKLTTEIPDFEAVKKSAENSNNAK